MALDLCWELADHEDAEVRLAVARGISRQLASGALSNDGDWLDRLIDRMLGDRDARIRQIASSLRGHSSR